LYIVEKALPAQVTNVLKPKTNVEKRLPLFVKQDKGRGLLEQLEMELEHEKYRPRTAATRGTSKSAR
jgi:hypothetical protein